MELAEALRRRRMVRRHTGAPVPLEVVDRIVAAGLRAPTAGDARGVAAVGITTPAGISSVAAACGEPEWVSRGRSPWLSTAGAMIVLCLEPEVYRQRYAQPDKDPAVLDAVPWWWVDGGAALEAMLLAAVDEGLGAGFLGGHRCGALADLLGLPTGVIVLGVVTLGPTAPEPARPPRPERRRHHHEHWEAEP